MKSSAQSGILKLMLRVLWLFFFALAASALLTLPIRSQQAQRNQSMLGASVSSTLPALGALAQQNTPLSPNGEQTPLSSPPEEISGRTVVLDPAHGGADFGARGPTGLAESDVVLDFARAARIALEAQRLRVLLTREGNQDPSFDNRSAMVNGLRNAIFISLHVSSSGPVGTARTYYYVFPSNVSTGGNLTGAGTTSSVQTFSPAAAPQTPLPPATARNSLVEWDHAQQASIDLSRQLASLVQTELGHRFKGSPEMPVAAPVRQLRTIAAPAIAIELSSIDVTDSKRLDQMAQPLAEAIGRAAAEFHYPLPAPAASSSGGH